MASAHSKSIWGKNQKISKKREFGEAILFEKSKSILLKNFLQIKI